MKRIALKLAAGMGLAAFALSALAADTRYLPPPGLYQIDIVNDFASRGPGGTLRHHDRADGASGRLDTEFQRIDGSRGSHTIPGTAPNQTCIEPVASGGLPKKLMIDGCKATKGVVTNGEMNAVHTCPWGSMKINLRQVDAKTWQTTVEQVRNPAVAGASMREQKSVLRLTRIGNCKG